MTKNRSFTIMFLMLLTCSQHVWSAQDVSQTKLADRPDDAQIKTAAKQFFELYAERKQFTKFMSFYAEDARLQDLVYGSDLNGKAAIADFFNWNKGDFKVVGVGLALTVEEQIVDGNSVVTKGVFNKFNFQQQALGPWRFIIFQRYDGEGKILFQEDWINYTPKANYTNGKNLNPD